MVFITLKAYELNNVKLKNQKLSVRLNRNELYGSLQGAL